MKNNLLFDFIVDKSKSTVFVNREFEAEQLLVWNAFTKREILDQWWAPKPWMSKTKFMNFEVGGRKLYAMSSPEGEEHWSIQDFTSITPITSFTYNSFFSDKDEHINNNLPNSEWNLEFKEELGVTTVNISIKHDTYATLEQMIQMGFKEGFTMTLNALSQLLKGIQNH